MLETMVATSLTEVAALHSDYCNIILCRLDCTGFYLDRGQQSIYVPTLQDVVELFRFHECSLGDSRQIIKDDMAKFNVKQYSNFLCSLTIDLYIH